MDASKVDREAFEQRASELEQLMEKTHAEYNRARGILDAIQKEFIDAQLKINTVQSNPDNLSEEDLQKLLEKMQAGLMEIGQKYEDAQHGYEQAIANHAFVNGQFIDCRTWQARVEKVMEYTGKAQEVLGMKNEKWDRLADKLELTGRALPNE